MQLQALEELSKALHQVSLKLDELGALCEGQAEWNEKSDLMKKVEVAYRATLTARNILERQANSIKENNAAKK